MDSPCLSPPFRSEAFAEDLDPSPPLETPSRSRLGMLPLAVLPVVLTLASGAAAWLVRGA